jgi:hypothetical protein
MGSLETLVGSPFIAPQGDDVFNIREPSRNASLDLGSGIAKTNEMQVFARLQPAKTFVDVPSPPIFGPTCAHPTARVLFQAGAALCSPWMNILYHGRVYATSIRVGVRSA